MKFGVRILPAADEDVDVSANYIARDNLSAALRFYDAVSQTYNELKAHPKRWAEYPIDHPRLSGIRCRSVYGFPNYLVFYRIDADMVEIIRVLYGVRDIPTELTES